VKTRWVPIVSFSISSNSGNREAAVTNDGPDTLRFGLLRLMGTV